MKRVEFLLAWEDRIWSTEVVDVPEHSDDRDNGVRFDIGDLLTNELIDWANKVLAPQEKYHGVALFAVYSLDPEDV